MAQAGSICVRSCSLRGSGRSWTDTLIRLFADRCSRRLPDNYRFKTRLPSGRVAVYAYPRYCFTNQSADIRALFCEYCEKLGIRWTESNPRNISVAQRKSVALLDAFVGPKR